MKNNNTFSWTNKNVEVIDVKKCGKGVFAKNDIKKKERIAVLGGYIMTIQEEENLPEFMNDNAVQIDDNLVLGIKKKSEFEIASFFNHSCNPNAGFNGQIFLVAMKDIKKGEQVTFDYGTVMFKMKNGRNYKFDCFCGEKECRKVITNHDWKIQKLQNKYRGYFQYFLEEKIKNKQYGL